MIASNTLSKIAPFGIVGFGLITAYFFGALIPQETNHGGIEGVALAFRNRIMLLFLLMILIFVPLNIWGSFERRRTALKFFFLLGFGASFVLGLFGHWRICQIHPEYQGCYDKNLYYSTYLSLLWKMGLPALVIPIIAHFSAKLTKILDTIQQIITSIIVPLFSTVLLFTPFGLLFYTGYLAIPLAWVVSFIVYKKRKEKTVEIISNSPLE